MAMVPTHIAFGQGLSDQLMRASEWVASHFSAAQVSPYPMPLDTITLVDERLRPRAPMTKDDIDVMTRMQLGHMNLRNPQRVTAQSHPELYGAWKTLAQRAGYGKTVPQLIVAETPMVNAFKLSETEMVVTTGMLHIMNLRETLAVLGHELGHGRRDHVGVRVAATGLFAGAGGLVGDYVARYGWEKKPEKAPGMLGRAWKACFGWLSDWTEKHFAAPRAHDLPPASFLGSVASIAAGAAIGSIAANHISVKPTELQADLDGVAISGDPEALASALRKLQAADHRGPVRKLWAYVRSGYPTTDQRVENIQRAARDTVVQPLPIALQPVPQATVSTLVADGRVQAATLERSPG